VTRQEGEGNIVETRDLSKRFAPFRIPFIGRERDTGGTTAVDRVSLRIREGEIFGLVGPNGAGKTTLIKMLTTLLLPTSGMAIVDGHDVVREGHHVRKVVGLVASNERSFYWRLTGRQNMVFFANLYGIPRREASRRTGELFELLGLENVADTRFDSYSTGMRQRLGMARGLISRPKILFMDEPTKGVDPIGSNQIINLIRDRLKNLWNSTVLITSHNLREIELLCDRVAIMDQGRIIATGSVKELRRVAYGVDTYRMKIGGVLRHRLESILGGLGSGVAVCTDGAEGVCDVEISFDKDTSGFPRMIRTLIEEGGQVLECNSVGESFDDVFQILCRGSAGTRPQTAEGGEGRESRTGVS